MDIKLYYIEGISRTDTPYFATKGVQATLAKQEEYFEEHIVQTISTSFYPPHYNNEIKFDIEDLTFNSSVNYLSLEYANKTYYYFIDDIEYISESIIKLYITMDVIQTYMFNIRIANGVIERKFINRWTNDNKINRNYIRENKSSNEFIISGKSYINKDYKQYVCFLKQTKHDKANTYGNFAPGTAISYFKNTTDLSTLMSPTTIPFDIKWFPGSAYQFKLPSSQNLSFFGQNVRTASYLAESVDMYICPFNPFRDIWLTPVSGSTNIEVTALYGTVEQNYLNFDDMHGETCYYFQHNLGLNMLIKRERIGFTSEFVKNTDINVNFSSTYITALFDDNYVQFKFGTSPCCTSYPLYTLDTPEIYCKYGFDPSNGSRFYYLTAIASEEEDRYNTLVIDTNILSLDLKNEPWAQYIANNKNRWAQLNNNNIANISNAGLSTGASFTKYGKIGTDLNASKAYNYGQARNSKGQFTKGIKKLGVSETKSVRDVYGRIPTEGNYTALAGAAINAGSDIFNQYYTEDNLLHSPASISQLGEAVNGMAAQQHLIFIQYEKCIDYEQCAQYFHRNGYLVNEYINHTDNIFEDVQNRYYFNVLKMSLPEVHLHGVIEDETTLDTIKERLEAGVRLWSVMPIVTYNFTHDETVPVTIQPSVGTRVRLTQTNLPYDAISDVRVTVKAEQPGMITNVLLSSFTYSNGNLSVDFLVTNHGNVDGVAKFQISCDATEGFGSIGDFTYDNVELDYIQ